MTSPNSYQPPPASSLVAPVITVIPPTRQQTLASNADSATHPITTSQPTSTHEQIARYIAQSEAPVLRRAKSSSSSMAESTGTAATSSRPSIPVPTRGRGNSSPTSSVAGSFISAREGSGDPDSPAGDAIGVDQSAAVFVEEPATLPTGAPPSISPTMRQLPFADRTAQQATSWTSYQPPGGPSSSSHLSPNPRTPQEATESDWIPYFPVDRSDVHKCEVRFETPDDGHPKMVAVKVLRPVGLDGCTESELLPKMMERASREAHAWLAIDHPNVVPLVGYTFLPLLSLISPWHEKGNLRSYLSLNPSVDRLKLLLDIAKGLAYLHSRRPPVVHGDIKPENILINDQGDALIMDFGLATVMEANLWYSSSHRQGGSLRWMAPELLLNSKETRSCSSDVYSYGGVAFEVMTLEPPHLGRSDTEISLALCNPNAPKEPFDQWAKYPELPEAIKEMI
ncbi:hypothetical protein FRC01_012060, partial [Tulasnella sp. 417]